MMIVYLVASLISVPFTCLLKEKVARKTLYLSVVTSMSDTPPQGLDGNPIKVDRCRKNVSLSVPLVRMSAAWWYVGQ